MHPPRSRIGDRDVPARKSDREQRLQSSANVVERPPLREVPNSSIDPWRVIEIERISQSSGADCCCEGGRVRSALAPAVVLRRPERK